MSTFITVASENDYLENLTSRADSIHRYLSQIDISDFESLCENYFCAHLKQLRKQVDWQKITVAFDETFIPFYGKVTNNWINGYTNNTKGAVGSYKFMVCSIVVRSKRYVLCSEPMHNCSDTTAIIERMLNAIKKRFTVDTVLLDRGFCGKETVRQLESQDVNYLILCPRWSNVKRHLKNRESVVVEYPKLNKHKTVTRVQMRYAFAYDCFGHNWAFVTNIDTDPRAIVLQYKSRWGIETNFRVMDLADIKSKSKNIVARFFFFLISILLFNSWLEVKEDMTFESYLDNLALANEDLVELLQKIELAKNMFGIPISVLEKQILSSFHTNTQVSLQLSGGDHAIQGLHESTLTLIPLQGVGAV